MNQDIIKISCVSYLNSRPFIYGLENSPVINEIELSLDIPSACAAKLKSGAVDIGLVPVVIIPELKESHVISDFCIGANGKVETVALFSQVPLELIESVALDPQSRTSVILARILADKYWKIHPRWVPVDEASENRDKETTALVLIGDKTFDLKGKYRYEIDLSEEWKKFTALTLKTAGLPFVFACWVANKNLPEGFVRRFNEALQLGLNRREEMVPELSITYPAANVSDYLLNKISYTLDAEKRQAMNLFLNYAGEIMKNP